MQSVGLPVANCPNLRDLGGLSAGARHVRPHKLLRAGALNALTPADVRVLADYGLATVVDLRAPKEAQATPDRLPHGTKYVADSVFPRDPADTGSNIIALREQYDKDPLSGFMNMVNTYRDMVQRPTSQAAFRTLLALAAANDRPGAALLYHCTSGKDRTGLATVFLLTLLGVSPAQIRRDYLASNSRLVEAREQRDRALCAAGAGQIMRATVRSLASVANEYLDAALLLIDQQYGGMPAYLTHQLGVTPQLRDRLQAIYLE